MIFRILLFFLFSQTAFSQYHITPLDLKNKLSQSTVVSMIEDREGFYWFGTGDGLNRFDGTNVIAYRYIKDDPNCICGNEIMDLKLDHQNNLWIATSSCLSKLNLNNYKFQNFFSQKDTLSLLDNYIIELELIDDYLVVFSHKGISLLNINSLEFLELSLDPKTKLLDITKHSDSKLLVATDTTILSLNINTQAIEEYYNFSRDYMNEGNLSNLYYKAPYVFLSFDDQLIVHNETTNKEVIFSSMGFNEVRDINEWDNKIWFSTSKGLVSFDMTTKEFVYGKDNGHSEGVVINSLVTSKDDLLVSIGTGIIKLSKNAPLFSTYRVDQTIGDLSGTNKIWHICNDEDAKILSTERGIYIMNNMEEIVPFSKKYPFTDDLLFVSSVISDDDNIWISTFDSGFYAIDVRTKHVTQYSNSQNSDRYIRSNTIRHCLDAGNQLLISTDDGLFSLDKKSKKVTEYDYFNSDIHSKLVRKASVTFIDLNDRLWIGTQAGLLVHHANGDSDVYSTKSDPPLSSNRVRSIHQLSDSILLVGTSAGLNYLNLRDNTIDAVDVSSGLVNDVIYSIECDSDDDVWVSTNRGISMINQNLEVINYNSFDGLQGNEFNTNSSSLDSEGDLLFGGLFGITKFDPQRVKHEVETKQALITEFEILPQGSFGGASLSYPLNSSYEFSYEQCNFVIRFTNINYENPENDFYYYKLEGFNHNWIRVDGAPEVQFMSLKEGDYTFKLRAGLRNGELSENIQSISISIEPPFYNSLIFRVLLLLAAILLGFYIYWLRVRSVENKNLELESLVTKQTSQLKAAYDLQETFIKELLEPLAFINNNNEVIQSNALYNDLLDNEGEVSVAQTHVSNSLKEIVNNGIEKLNSEQIDVLENEYSIGERFFQLKMKRVITQKENYGTTILLRDITNAKEAEFSLRQNEVLFRSYFEKSPLGIVLVKDPLEPIVDCNKKFCEILNISKEIVLTKRMVDLTHPEDREKDILSFMQAVSDRKEYLLESNKRLVCSMNDVSITETHVTFVYDKNGVYQYLFALVNDVTEQRENQKNLIEARTKLIQSEKLASLGRITAGVAHEINNPVNFIYNGANNLKTLLKALKSSNAIDEESVYEDINTMIEAINDGAVRTASIVKSLGMFTQKSGDLMSSYNIITGLDSSIVLLSHMLKDRIKIIRDYNISEVLLKCYPIQLNQVFINILTNAIEAIENKGSIYISIKESEKKVAIQFKDTGIGIEPDNYNEILEPFYSTKGANGTGLGLSISQSILERHNGTIFFMANEPKGTVVTLVLPR